MNTSKIFCSDSGCEFNLHYELTSCQVCVENSDLTTYGVTVRKTDRLGKLTEQTSICDLTTNQEKAVHFLELIRTGNVTPCTLVYIAEDYLE